MNETIKTKWVAALRSSEFKQGKNTLKMGDEYCCLGVLCELYRREVGGAEWELSQSCETGTVDTFLGKWDKPAEPVRTWAEMLEANPEIPAFQTSLTELNDTGKTFSEIADIIEKYL